MKSIFIMMIGISGSGKSTVAQKYAEKYDAIILSSDKIREELYGSEECQDNPEKVFRLLYGRAKEYLASGKNVICDATNLTSKHRKHLLKNEFRNLDIDSFAVIVTASLEDCIKRQNSRKRKVPEYVIKRQLCSFEFPFADEGWTRPPEIYNNCSEPINLNLKFLDLENIDQTGKNHLENAFVHSVKVAKKAEELKPDDLGFKFAATYHDIGKVYTRTEDEEGNAHFYGHQNASTYLITCSIFNGLNSEIYRVLRLVQYHDLIWQSGKKFESLSEDLRKDLKMLNECDIAGTLHPDKLKDTSLLDFISFFPDDWKERISREPFNINIKEADDFVLLKYNQIESDFSYRICRECRGCILTKNEHNQWIYVCRAFDKFFNYGEIYADDIDWSTARVMEKVDGSLMRVWCYKGTWHLSTNGTIDAFSAMISDTEKSFGDVFEQALGYSVEELGTRYLDKDYTYMFELTSPETRVVISYPDSVYYLSRRNIHTLEESLDRIYLPNVQYPKIYNLKTIEDVISAAGELTRDEEGFVVNDLHCRRIKVKSPEYLIAAKLTANHNLSNRSIYRLILNVTIDDLLAYAPEYRDRADKAIAKINKYKTILENDWQEISNVNYDTRKDFAEAARKKFDSAYLFLKYDDAGIDAFSYIQKMHERRLLNTLERIEIDEIV